MFTSIDKALVAIVMAGLFMLNEFAGIDVGLSEETVAAVIAAATPILVYFVPNKRAGALAMWALISRVVVQFLAALVVGWRRDRELKRSGAREAELKGLEDVNERAAKADAAARRARADPELLRDDGYRRD